MPQDIQRKPCLRCLLAEAGEADLSRVIAERISVIPPENRADDALYSKRLGLCKACEHLNSGTCGKCGCYVELRAARADSHCPHEKRFW